MLLFWFRTLAIYAAMMCLQRLVFVSFLSLDLVQVGLGDFVRLMFMGLRFDLMAFSYFSLPFIVFGFWLFSDSSLKRMRAFQLIAVYFLAGIALFSFLSAFDLVYFSSYGDRLNQAILDGAIWNLRLSDQILKHVIGLCLIAILSFLLQIRNSRRLVIEQAITWRQLAFLGLPLLLFARGAIGQHHLDLRHTQISQNSKLNLAVLNSAYALDQALRRRR